MRTGKTSTTKLRESQHIKVARIIYAQAQAVFPLYVQPEEIHLATVSGVCVAEFLLQNELPRLRGAAPDELGAARCAGTDARAALQHAQSDVSPLPSKSSGQDE